MLLSGSSSQIKYHSSRMLRKSHEGSLRSSKIEASNGTTLQTHRFDYGLKIKRIIFQIDSKWKILHSKWKWVHFQVQLRKRPVIANNKTSAPIRAISTKRGGSSCQAKKRAQRTKVRERKAETEGIRRAEKAGSCSIKIIEIKESRLQYKEGR